MGGRVQHAVNVAECELFLGCRVAGGVCARGVLRGGRSPSPSPCPDTHTSVLSGMCCKVVVRVAADMCVCVCVPAGVVLSVCGREREAEIECMRVCYCYVCLFLFDCQSLGTMCRMQNLVRSLFPAVCAAQSPPLDRAIFTAAPPKSSSLYVQLLDGDDPWCISTISWKRCSFGRTQKTGSCLSNAT